MTIIRVNLVSESAFSVKGHGVHTAFVEMRRSLEARPEIKLKINKFSRADITHIHTVGPYSLAHLLIGKGRKVISAHLTPDSFVGSLVLVKYWYGFARRYLRWFYNRADTVLAVSPEVAEELRRIGVERPIEVFPNTIDTRRYQADEQARAEARRSLGWPKDEFVVIGVGQVQPRKGIETFAACAEALPDVKFVWVGGLPFKHLAAEHGRMEELMQGRQPNLIFTGIIDLEEVKRYYWAADVFLLPSYQETFGIVVIEAAAAGLPVVLRDLEVYQDIFAGGYLAAEEDGFVPEIKKLISNPSYYRDARSKTAKISGRYDSTAGAERLVGIYAGLHTKNPR